MKLRMALIFLLLLYLPGLLISQTSRPNPTATRSDTLLADEEQKKAHASFSTGDFKTAQLHARQALAIRQNLFGPDHLKVAESLDSVGWTEICFDQPAKADSCFRKALAIRLAQPQPDKIMVAKSYHNLAVLYGRKQDFGGALDNIQRALALAIETVGKNHAFTANLYLGLGNCHGMVSDWDKALQYYKTAYDILTALYGDCHEKLVAPLNNIAEMYGMKGEYEKSVEYHNRTRTMIATLYGENIYFANSCHYLADVYKKMGDHANAILWYQKSAAVHQKLNIPLPFMYRSINNAIADLYYARQEYPRSLEFINKSLESFKPAPQLKAGWSPRQASWPISQEFLQAIEIKAKTHHRLAHTNKNAAMELQASLDMFSIAAAVLDSMRRDLQIGRERSRQILSERADQILQQATGVALELADLMDKNRNEELAFRFVQQSKSAALALALRDLQTRKLSGIDEATLERERELNARLARAITDLDLQMEQGAQPDDSTCLTLQASYYACASEYQQMIRDLEKKYPHYYRHKYAPSDISMAELGKSLDEKSALLEYYIADSTLYIFAINADGHQVVRKSFTPEMREQIHTFCRAIKGDREVLFLNSSRLLYETLIAPVHGAIAGRENLVILPHDVLYSVAYEALLADGSTDASLPQMNKVADAGRVYLVEKHNISYHYSSRIYQGAVSDKRQRASVNRHDLLAYAPFSDKPGFKLNAADLFAQFIDSENKYPSWITRSGDGFSRLPSSAHEVRQIVSTFQKHQRSGASCQGKQASKARFMQECNSARVIHLATHSFVNPEQPQLSGIAFHGAQARNQDDVILFAGDIYGLNLDADLVVLSSCESGVGQILKGEGLMSLTRCFLHAGARNVIASLWKVQDQAAAELMIDFYENTFTAKNYKEALRQAKCKFIQSNQNASPALWSGFVLYGE